jgi:two-component system, cell cycle sensor histidine kinase and response regulator CckA
VPKLQFPTGLQDIAPAGWGLIGVGAVLCVAGTLTPWDIGQVTTIAAGTALVALGGLVLQFRAKAQRRIAQKVTSAKGLLENDPSARLISDDKGMLHYLNPAAKTMFGDRKTDWLPHVLGGGLVNPSEVAFRLQSKALAFGSAVDEVVSEDGPLKIVVSDIADNLFSWSFEAVLEARGGVRNADALSLPMLTASKSGTILFMNEAFRRLIGSRVKTLDRVFVDLPLRSGAVHEVSCIDTVVRANVVCIHGANGRQEVYLVPNEQGREFTGDSDDLDFFEDMPVALLRLHPEGSIISANRQARTLLQTNITEGMFFSDVIEGLWRSITDWILETAKRGTPAQSEVLKARNTQIETFLQVSLSRMGYDENTQIIAVLNDATELKTLEAQFVQSQKMQAIGQLAGGIAHDFNNLLTAISGHCDLLLLRHDQGDTDHEDLIQIHQNANCAASLVGQLLAYSRKQNLRPEVIDLRETLSDLTHLLGRLVGEQLTLTWSHDPGLGTIRADKRQLEQVIMNLVVNARDAMPEGGEIRIETTSRTLTEPMKRDRAELLPGQYACIEVIDQGTGIAKDKLPKIFEPFFTTKRVGEGTGLGLFYGIWDRQTNWRLYFRGQCCGHWNYIFALFSRF